MGAVLVCEGDIVAAAHNAPVSLRDPTAHAEILALRAGGRSRGNYRLSGTTLYVTVEPCMMCVGALIHARVQRVVFGCREPKTGALTSLFDASQPTRDPRPFEVSEGVCADEAASLLQEFFHARRGA